MGLVGFSSADWELMSPRRLRLLWSGGLHCGTVRAFSANGVFPVSVDTAVALVLTRGDDARLRKHYCTGRDPYAAYRLQYS